MRKILNIFAFVGLLLASKGFAEGSTGGGSGVGIVSRPGLMQKPSLLLLQVLKNSSDRLDDVAEGQESNPVKANINARVLGYLGRSTIVSVTREGFDLLKESVDLEAPVKDRASNKEYTYSQSTDSSISLESLDSEDNVIILPSASSVKH